METTIAVMLYLGILFTGEEYHKETIYDKEDANYSEIMDIKSDDDYLSNVEDDYLPKVDDLRIYKYDDEGEVVIIDPEEMD